MERDLAASTTEVTKRLDAGKMTLNHRATSVSQSPDCPHLMENAQSHNNSDYSVSASARGDERTELKDEEEDNIMSLQ